MKSQAKPREKRSGEPRPATKAETYKGRSITYIRASGLYVISDEPLGPSVRVAFSASHARRIIDGMKKAGARP